MIREMEMNAAYQGVRLDDYLKYMGMSREALKAQNEPEAIRRVKNELVIEAIRKAEKIEPAEADIEKAIEDQAKTLGRDVEEFRKSLTDEQRDYLKENAAIQMVLDLLKKDAKIVEKTEEKAEKPAKKPAAKKAAKADEEEEKPAKKPAAKKAAKADEAEEKPAKKPAAKKAAKADDTEEKPAKKPAAKKAAKTEE